MRAVARVGFTEAENATAVWSPQRGHQIIEADADEPGTLNDIDDRAHALADRGIAGRERLMDPGAWRYDVAHPVVLEANHGVRHFAESRQRLHCLRRPTLSFKGERQGRE